jgi:hypothetical protein
MRGGKRPGAGRPRGARSKKRAARELAVAVAGITPMDFLLEGLAFHAKLIRHEQAKGAAADDAVIAAAYAAGREYAKDAAPYCHAKLASIEHNGPGGGAIEVTAVDARERLAALIAAAARVEMGTVIDGRAVRLPAPAERDTAAT